MLNLPLRNNSTNANEALVGLLEDAWELLEGIRDDKAGIPHRPVLCIGGLEVAVGHTAGVTELNFGGEHLGAGTDGPGDDGLLDLAALDSLDDAIFFNTTDFTEEDEHLALGVGLVAEEMIDEGGSRVAITTDSDTLVGTVGDNGRGYC